MSGSHACCWLALLLLGFASAPRAQEANAPPCGTIVLFDRGFWGKVLNLEALADQGFIKPGDLKLFSFADTAEEAWAVIAKGVA